MVSLNASFGSTKPRTSSADRRTAVKPSAAAAKELTDTDRHTLAFRLAALAIVAYLARFLIGLVKYALDATLILLLATSVAAVVGPGAKSNALTQLLVQVESFVDPAFALVADRGLSVVSGYMRTAAQYLGVGQGTTQT